ncbi:hypothetical protein, partial [Nocardia cyriacigeorgica]|uniref:hypothetical protein n=1 Tax=Nocardia cyriacigeorgica TaxID=135487 RepID=UPI002457992B
MTPGRGGGRAPRGGGGGGWGPRGSRTGGFFYASFAASRPSTFMAAEVADLRARHPRLVAEQWFVVDDDQ